MCLLDVGKHAFYGLVHATSGVCVRKGYGEPCFTLGDKWTPSFWETKWFALVLALYRALGWLFRYGACAPRPPPAPRVRLLRSRLGAVFALVLFSYWTAADDRSLFVQLPKTGTGKMKLHKLVAGLFYFFAPPLLPVNLLAPTCSAHDARGGGPRWPGGFRLSRFAAARLSAALLALHVFAALGRFGYDGWAQDLDRLSDDDAPLALALTFFRGGYNTINLVPVVPDGFMRISFVAKCALTCVAALVVVALVAAAAYWVPRRPTYWSDVGHATMAAFMLHRTFLPPLITLFTNHPGLVKLDAFLGVPLFLALHAFLALELPALLAKLRRATAGAAATNTRRGRPDDDQNADVERVPFITEQKTS